mmetsp:Transcript_88710/g.153945  ORF Transcript_88710/g.153945 Transcript_88710/m.153945 type:complete len:145 (-) Transcript_88710:2256-2690(-)
MAAWCKCTRLPFDEPDLLTLFFFAVGFFLFNKQKEKFLCSTNKMKRGSLTKEQHCQGQAAQLIIDGRGHKAGRLGTTVHRGAEFIIHREPLCDVWPGGPSIDTEKYEANPEDTCQPKREAQHKSQMDAGWALTSQADVANAVAG